MKFIKTKQILAIVLSIGMGCCPAACGQDETEKDPDVQLAESEPGENQEEEPEAGSREDVKSKEEKGMSPEEEAAIADIMAGTISYSHGGILKPEKYPCWSMITIDHDTGEEKEMVQFDDRMYVDGDDEMIAFFGGGEEALAHTAQDQDLVYVYTMPYDGTVNIELTARVFSENSDGIKVYCYLNDKSDYLVEETLVTAVEDVVVHGAYGVELKKGDKFYCGYNPNESYEEDDGNFYVKLTYLSVDN